MKGAGLFSLFLVILVASQVLMKAGMNSLTGREVNMSFFLKALSSMPVVLGILLSAGGMVVWLVVLSRYELSYSYLIAGFSFALVLLASVVIFKEPISLWRWVGAALIMIGVALVSRTG